MKTETIFEAEYTMAPAGLSQSCADRMALRRLIYDMVALVFHVEPRELEGRTRGRKQAAYARQVAMYLAHISAGMSLSEVGRLFGRDRTTVAHACARIEDARDDAYSDRMLEHLEGAVAQQMNLIQLTGTGGGGE